MLALPLIWIKVGARLLTCWLRTYQMMLQHHQSHALHCHINVVIDDRRLHRIFLQNHGRVVRPQSLGHRFVERPWLVSLGTTSPDCSYLAVVLHHYVSLMCLLCISTFWPHFVIFFICFSLCFSDSADLSRSFCVSFLFLFLSFRWLLRLIKVFNSS